jgi:hypothetical protein
MRFRASIGPKSTTLVLQPYEKWALVYLGLAWRATLVGCLWPTEKVCSEHLNPRAPASAQDLLIVKVIALSAASCRPDNAAMGPCTCLVPAVPSLGYGISTQEVT